MGREAGIACISGQWRKRKIPSQLAPSGYLLRTGWQWKALDAAGIYSGATARLRFQQWVAAGAFLELWRVRQERYDELRGWMKLTEHGWAMTKAPLGGEKTGPYPADRREGGIKRSLLAEAVGVPAGLAVDDANRRGMKLGRATLEGLPMPRSESSPDQPQGMCLDQSLPRT